MPRKSGKFINIIYQQDKTYKINFYSKKETLEEKNNRIVKIDKNNHQAIKYLNLCKLTDGKKPFPIVSFSQSLSFNEKIYDIKLLKEEFILFSSFEIFLKKEEIPAKCKLKFHIFCLKVIQKSLLWGGKLFHLF